MNLQTFQQLMEQRGFKVVGKAAYGMAGDYPLMVSYLAPRQWRVTLTAGIDDWKSFYKEMKRELKYACSYDSSHLSAVIVLKAKNYQETFDKLLSDLTGYLRGSGVRVPQTCAACGQPGCDALCCHGGGYDPVHQGCLEQMIGAVREKAAHNQSKGNYLTGLIGAVLGAIVGVLPSVLSVLWTEKIYAMLFALIPLCIYHGYRLCKGKMNKAVIALTIVLSVVSVYLLEIILLLAEIMEEYGATVAEAAGFLGYLLPDPGIWGAMTSDSIFSFVFIALGIWIAWGQISRTATGEVRTAEGLRATVLPYGEALRTQPAPVYPAAAAPVAGGPSDPDGFSLLEE